MASKKTAQPALELRSANFDIMTSRMLASFADPAGNMVTINSTLDIGAAKDQGAAMRAACIALLRGAADTLEAASADAAA